MNNQLETTIIKTIMDHAIKINASIQQECRDFQIMTSPMHENTLVLRWTRIDLKDLDKPKQCFHYECFYPDGSPQYCSINYTNQKEANTFFFSLNKLHQQDFCNDHNL